MKYRSKLTVDAIQWDGDNQNEFTQFIIDRYKDAVSMPEDGGFLSVCYHDEKQSLFRADVPMNGWVVYAEDGLHFYKDETFKKKYEEAPDIEKPDWWKGMDKDIEDFFRGFDDMKPRQETIDNIRKAAIDNMPIFNADSITADDKGITIDIIDADNISVKVEPSEETFESVLDEMKELHAKKNEDYGDAVHVNFLKYGPVASLSRLSEKMQRAEHILLTGRNEVKEESLADTLLDMAITSAMLYMEIKNKDDEKH